MDFLKLLDLPNNTQLTPKHSIIKKENTRGEIKQYIRVKVDDSRDDYFFRILKRVKIASTNILSADDKKEYRMIKNRISIDKITTLIEELKATGYQAVEREKNNKRKYIYIKLDIMKPSQMI
jgi:hypothetical protein